MYSTTTTFYFDDGIWFIIIFLLRALLLNPKGRCNTCRLCPDSAITALILSFGKYSVLYIFCWWFIIQNKTHWKHEWWHSEIQSLIFQKFMNRPQTKRKECSVLFSALRYVNKNCSWRHQFRAINLCTLGFVSTALIRNRRLKKNKCSSEIS